MTIKANSQTPIPDFGFENWINSNLPIILTKTKNTLKIMASSKSAMAGINVTDNPLTSLSASKEFSGKVIDKHTFKVWEGLYHEIHH